MSHRLSTRFLGLTLVLVVASAALWAPGAEASHFRYGHLTWAPNPAAGPNGVSLTLVNAFRRDGYPGSAGDGLAAIGDNISEGIGGTSLDFGDGNGTGQLTYDVIAIDPVENWLLARALDPVDLAIGVEDPTIDHGYPGPGPWQAGINSCCRTSFEVNNPDAAYRVSTTVSLAGGNTSPVSGLPAIVDVAQGPASSFTVPAADSDPNTALRFRLALPAEAGSFFNQPPGLAIDPVTGIVTWNTLPWAVGSLWSCQVIIEDRDALTLVLKTQVAVDFLIRITICPPTNRPPQFAGATPACGSVIPATVGSNVSFTVEGSDPDAGDVLTLNHAGLPAGATTAPVLPTNGNPVSTVFGWTPPAAGSVVVTFTITDGCASALCNFTIEVSSNRPPDCSAASASVAELWPPNHKMVPVSIRGVTDPDGDPIQVTVTSVTQDEPINGSGDGDTCPDAEITATGCNLRSERTGNRNVPGNGRVYRIGFLADDGRGGTCTGTATVCVPHDQGRRSSCVEDVLVVNSLTCGGGSPARTVRTTGSRLNYSRDRQGRSTIEYTLDRAGAVELAVFDVSGRQVTVLVDGAREAGTHAATWDTAGVSSGVYYVRLVSGNVQESQRIVLVQ